MLLDRWKTACAKLNVAMCETCGYDTAVSGGGHRRLRHIGEEKCIRNLSLSRWQPLCWQDVTRLLKVWVWVLVLALLVQRSLVAIQSQALLLAQALDTLVMRATSATSLLITSLRREIEISEGMLPARGVPFCLPKA